MSLAWCYLNQYLLVFSPNLKLFYKRHKDEVPNPTTCCAQNQFSWTARLNLKLVDFNLILVKLLIFLCMKHLYTIKMVDDSKMISLDFTCIQVSLAGGHYASPPPPDLIFLKLQLGHIHSCYVRVTLNYLDPPTKPLSNPMISIIFRNVLIKSSRFVMYGWKWERIKLYLYK